jgi:hypothetical protein
MGNNICERKREDAGWAAAIVRLTCRPHSISVSSWGVPEPRLLLEVLKLDGDGQACSVTDWGLARKLRQTQRNLMVKDVSEPHSSQLGSESLLIR